MTKTFKNPVRLLLQVMLTACLPTAVVVAADTAPTDELTLNGRGTRQTMFVDLYTCELYLPARTRDEKQIVSLNDRVRVKLQVHGTPPATLPDNWRSVLKQELSDRLFRRVRDQYRDLAEGDQVELDYLPGQGTRVRVNGEEIVFDPGRELMASMLTQWIGGEPVSDNLKHDLLGGQ